MATVTFLTSRCAVPRKSIRTATLSFRCPRSRTFSFQIGRQSQQHYDVVVPGLNHHQQQQQGLACRISSSDTIGMIRRRYSAAAGGDNVPFCSTSSGQHDATCTNGRRQRHTQQQQLRQQQQPQPRFQQYTMTSTRNNGIDHPRDHHNVSSSGGHPRLVAVTGIGCMTPLGLNFQDTWDALLMRDNGGSNNNSNNNNNNHNTGMTSLHQALEYQYNSNSDTAFLQQELKHAQQLSCQVVASVRAYRDKGLYNPRTTPRYVQFALHATHEALQNAGLLQPQKDDSSVTSDDEEQPVLLKIMDDIDQSRIGVSIGSGMSSVSEIVKAASLSSYRRLSPYFVPNVLSNSASGRVSIQYGVKGPSLSQSTACSASTHAIGDGIRCIQHNQADLMIVGGSESAIDTLSIAGFTKLKALSTKYNDTPQYASRPFDSNRDGFVMGEGCAILILEELQHALQRRQKRPFEILALAIGYGASSDGYHITAPDPDGIGAQLCMRRALQEASRNLSVGSSSLSSSRHDNIRKNIMYVNAHATSTPKGDEIEAKAIEKVFFDSSSSSSSSFEDHVDDGKAQLLNFFDEVYVSSTKGSTGHLLGAAGAIEAAFTVQALQDQIVPSTRNLHDASQMMVQNITFIQDGPPLRINSNDNNNFQYAMSNSFGFGGTNASLVFQRWDPKIEDCIAKK